jgi:hypothetical protein
MTDDSMALPKFRDAVAELIVMASEPNAVRVDPNRNEIEYQDANGRIFVLSVTEATPE